MQKKVVIQEITQRIQNNSNLVCIEKDCKMNRVITNWIDLQGHYNSQHKVYTLEKFEKKINLKQNQFNEKQRMQMEENITKLIKLQEQQISERICCLFKDLQKVCFKILQEYTNQNKKIEIFSYNNQFEPDLQQYIDIYYSYQRSPQLYQVDWFLDEFQYKLNRITNDLINVINQVEQSQKFESIQFLKNIPQKQQDFQYQPPNQFSQPIQLKNYFQEYQKQESNFESNKFQQQEDQNNIPLKNYKNIQKQQQFYPKEESSSQQQQQQQVQSQQPFQEEQQHEQKQYIAYIPKTEINTDDDRIQFQLPSETTQNYKKNNFRDRFDKYENQNKIRDNMKDYDLYEIKPKSRQQQEEIYEIKENTEKKNQQREEDVKKKQNDEIKEDQVYQKMNIVGKKFDITNSDKHLKYSSRFTQFSCIQQGVALVEGAFTLNDNAKVKFVFTERLDKALTASFGIQNVDNQGKKIGTLNFCMDQSGYLYQTEGSRQGSIKIDLNEEFILSYTAEKRVLMFRKQDIYEYIHLEGSISGCFKFYVKLYGLQVQIIK
ncbi:unnamed protein product [Paramecium sonneborni]|uniref:Uncharacterized protein n=1 Tax=Paramecium sonneborni TaxID=65129 RepID=A0A8S1KXR4_9CILI|nr:unnamed protein product [Paramecium sonneborni]